MNMLLVHDSRVFRLFSILLCFITGVVDGMRVTVKNFLSGMVVVVMRRDK